MRLSTIIVSSVFVLAGMSSAIPVEREDMLVTRFADFDFLADVEARAYGNGPELYSRGGGMSTLSQGRNSLPPSYDPPPYHHTPPSLAQTNSQPPSYPPPPYQRTPPSPAQTNIRPPTYRSSRRDPVVMRQPRGSRRRIAVARIGSGLGRMMGSLNQMQRSPMPMNPF